MDNEISFFDQNNWQETDYGFYYLKNNIKFIRLSHKESLSDVLKTIEAIGNSKKYGIISSNLSDRDIELLRLKNISYILNNKEIKIFNQKSKAISEKYFLENKVSPTLIASPTGLEIIDALMWSTNLDLAISPTQFCLQYDLSRPKLSQMIKGMSAVDLIHLKEILLLKNIDWWLEIFDSATTKRKMTPSQTSKTKRYKFQYEMDIYQLEGEIQDFKKHNFEVEIGGLTFLNLEGDMKSTNFDLMAKKDEIDSIINSMNLVPAKKSDIDQIIFITPFINNLHDERLYSSTSSQESPYRDLNKLRILWGLNYNESRVQEQRKYLLEDYFARARTRYN